MMVRFSGMRSLFVMALTFSPACAAWAQEVPPPPPAAVPVSPPAAQPRSGQSQPADGTIAPSQGLLAPRQARADMPGPIDSVSDIQDTLDLVFMSADQNHDGLISRDEADDAGDMLVGGLFFSADANGDGKLTDKEAQAVEQKFLRQNPLLRFVVDRVKTQGGQKSAGNDPVEGVLRLLDTDSDDTLSATEVRQMVDTSVKALYQSADVNRDNQMDANEWTNAIRNAAWSVVENVFQTADTDNDKALSQEEFTKALAEPAKTVFAILDVDRDGKLTEKELERSSQILSWRLRSISPPKGRNTPETTRARARTSTIDPATQPASLPR